MKTIDQILPNVLTEASAQPTKERPVNIADWAKFLHLETFDDPQLEKLVEKCARWALAMKYGGYPRWLTIMGKCGNGKTHCASRLFEWSQARFDWDRCRYIHHTIYWPRFIGELRSRDGHAFNTLNDTVRWPVLFLDDIGAERDTSGFAAEQLNSLLGQRVDKWTIITSNLNLEQLASIDPRIADRIVRERGNEYIELDTVSYGLRKKQ